MSRNNKTVALMLVAFVGIGFSYPFLATFSTPNMYHEEGVLPGNAARRGAYINSSSQDYGPNPDFKKVQRDSLRNM